MNLKNAIRTIPDWPKPGIMFRDITALLQDPVAFNYACNQFIERYKLHTLDKIVSIDARGFIFAAVLAQQLHIGFVPVRKQGKLPHTTISKAYSLEYGDAVLEIHTDAIQANEQVLIIDDLLATGGTALAAAHLVEQLGGIVVECGFLIELPDLNGRERLQNYPVFAMLSFDGD